MLNEFELTGRARTHIVELEKPHCGVHYEVAASLLAMAAAATAAGIDLLPVSSFRDFDRQVTLWNRKWQGERPLYDRGGAAVDHASLSEGQLVDAILCWSAVPGGSRHHWGSDVDVIDAAAVPPGYQVQLLPQEYGASGVFARLTAWLDANMQSFGFFRPYRSDQCGTGREPWHLSYAPVALQALEGLSLPVLRRAIAGSDLLGKSHVLDRLPEIYTRFVLAIDPPPAAMRRAS